MTLLELKELLDIELAMNPEKQDVEILFNGESIDEEQFTIPEKG